MVAHLLTTSRVRDFVEALEQWAEARWATTVDAPIIIAGCTDRSVIFELSFRMELPDGYPVLETDPVSGQILRQGVIERSISPRREVDQGPEEVPREEAQGSEVQDEEEALSCFTQAVASAEHGEGRMERGGKRRVDWTEDIAPKRRRDEDPV